MADNFQLTGTYSSIPFAPSASADFQVTSAISELMILSDKLAAGVDLASDGPQSVQLVALTAANVVILKVTSGLKVDAIITTADGALQTIPVDGLLFLVTQTVPVTALALKRTPGVDTNVRVFLGQL